MHHHPTKKRLIQTGMSMLLQHGYKIEQMQRERTAEEDASRQLRLEFETLRAPERIESLVSHSISRKA